VGLLVSPGAKLQKDETVAEDDLQMHVGWIGSDSTFDAEAMHDLLELSNIE
jgi:hypothetical protein